MDDGYSYLVLITATAVCVCIAAYFIWKYVKTRVENVTEEDIMTMVNEGHEQGVLESSEAEMITNIFEFDDTVAGDIMTNRKHIVAISKSLPIHEAARFVLREGNNSRYPVYGKDLDDIVGMIHMRDVLVYAEEFQGDDAALADIPGLLREARFIPETRKISSLFKEMQSGKIHMEIVIDEYGQTAGLITMEDILEEIVGNILDEYDVDEAFIVQSEDDSLLMSGMTPLKEVEEALQIQLPEADLDTYDTINGLLISRLNRIPGEEEQPRIHYLGYLFEIIKVENKRIHSVRVTSVSGQLKRSRQELLETAVSSEEFKG